MSHLLWIILLTFAPSLELRASIPYALLVAKWHWAPAAVVCIAANTALAPIVWIFVDKVMHLFLRIGWIDRLYQRYAHSKRVALERLVDRWGVLGLAVFIGVPLPGTGVYSGCLAAYLLEYRFRDYLLAAFLGCVLAGTVVTTVVATGNKSFTIFYQNMHPAAAQAPPAAP